MYESFKFKSVKNLLLFIFLQLVNALGRVKRLEYEEDSKKRIKLGEIRNQISSLNGNEDDGDIRVQIYRNNLVTLQLSTNTLDLINYSCFTEFCNILKKCTFIPCAPSSSS